MWAKIKVLANIDGKNVNQCNHHGKQCGDSSKKVKIELIYDYHPQRKLNKSIDKNYICNFIINIGTINISQYVNLTSKSFNGWII